MAKETMTPRERWLAVLRREAPDRVPMDYWGTPETSAFLRRHLGCRTIAPDARPAPRRFRGQGRPRYVGPRLPRMTDEFGCRFRRVDYGTGVYQECIHFPLAGFAPSPRSRRSYAGRGRLVGLRGAPPAGRALREAPHPRRRLGALPHLQGAPRPGAGLRRPRREPRDRPLLPRQALRPRLRDAVRIYEASRAG